MSIVLLSTIPVRPNSYYSCFYFTSNNALEINFSLIFYRLILDESGLIIGFIGKIINFFPHRGQLFSDSSHTLTQKTEDKQTQTQSGQ